MPEHASLFIFCSCLLLPGSLFNSVFSLNYDTVVWNQFAVNGTCDVEAPESIIRSVCQVYKMHHAGQTAQTNQMFQTKKKVLFLSAKVVAEKLEGSEDGSEHFKIKMLAC